METFFFFFLLRHLDYRASAPLIEGDSIALHQLVHVRKEKDAWFWIFNRAVSFLRAGLIVAQGGGLWTFNCTWKFVPFDGVLLLIIFSF